IERICGTDVSYEKHTNMLFAAAIILTYPDLAVVEEQTAVMESTFPYVPGLLSFREIPALIKAFDKVKNIPDVVICDGHGSAHPRGFGLACHLGVILELPTIGSAKTILCGKYTEPGKERESYSEIINKGKNIGTALRTRRNVNPVFVSQGYKIGIDFAREVILTCSPRFRIPEPIRKAHTLVNRVRKEF
ncbi:deoxyribonuclease V, partial [bacterium]|nr:deoxyribonuclease V [bacterium]